MLVFDKLIRAVSTADVINKKEPRMFTVLNVSPLLRKRKDICTLGDSINDGINCPRTSNAIAVDVDVFDLELVAVAVEDPDTDCVEVIDADDDDDIVDVWLDVILGEKLSLIDNVEENDEDAVDEKDVEPKGDELAETLDEGDELVLAVVEGEELDVKETEIVSEGDTLGETIGDTLGDTLGDGDVDTLEDPEALTLPVAVTHDDIVELALALALALGVTESSAKACRLARIRIKIDVE